ncbi:hypothetical protein HDU99_009606, partial [Rhizoclosmatium hyalinum]
KEPEATTSTRGRPRRGARPTDLGESSSESSFDEDEEEEEFEDDGITPPPAARPPRTKRIRTTVNDSEDEDSRQEPQQAQTTAPRLRPTDFGMDDAFRGKKVVVVEEVKKGDDEDGKDDLLPVGTVGAQSDSVIKKANDLSRAKKDLLNAKKKKAESLTQELATLERANQALTTQNARLPDLENRLFGVEQRLKEEIEKKAEEARAAMEVDLNKIISGSSRPASVKDDNGDTVMTNGNDSLLSLQQPNNHIAEESESTATTYLRAKIQIMTSHITKKEADNKLLSAQIQAIRTEDATHELNYKKIISMCCNLEVEQIDAAMLEVLLAAVESDDNGTGAIAPGSEPVVPPAPVLDTTMADVEGDDILAGLLDADQHQQVDAALDGLLFKVTSLSSI